MSRYNPANPAVAGSEWRPGARQALALSASLGRGPQIIARATESVTDLAQVIGQPVDDPSASRTVICDVYDKANPIIDAQSYIIALAASNTSNAAGWLRKASGVEHAYDSNAYLMIQDVIVPGMSLSTGATDQLIYRGVGPTTSPQVRFHAGAGTLYDGVTGAGGATLTGKRIVAVRVVVVSENQCNTGVRYSPQLQIGATAYPAHSGSVVVPGGNPNLVENVSSFYENPATGLPWCHADAVALTDGTNSFGIGIATKNSTGDFVVTAMFLQFVVVPERRVATAVGYPTGGSDHWVVFSVLDPDDLASTPWTKTNGHTYQFIYSTTFRSDATTIPFIDSSNVAGHTTDGLTDTVVRTWTLDHSAAPISELVTPGAAGTPGQIPTLMIVAGVASADSLPYIDCNLQRITNLTTFTQRISTESAQDYGSATIVVGRGSGGQTAPLVVSLRLASAPTVDIAGTSVSIPVADVPADGKYHLVTVRFPTAYTATGTPALLLRAVTTSPVGWEVPLLMHRSGLIPSSNSLTVLAAAQGIGGSADMANGDATLDLPWSISLAPLPPQTLARSVLTVSNGPALAMGMLPLTVSYVHLTWATPATPLGAAFGYYELQREDDGTWYPIFYGTTEAGHYFNDIESERNTPVNYRIRSVRSDGGFSSWATFTPVTVPTEGDCDLIIATNVDLDLALPFEDLGNRSWQSRREASIKEVDYLGRDYPVQWAPTEKRGEQFTRNLAVALNDGAVGDTVPSDRDLFDPAVALLEQSGAPYLVYCTAEGRRTQVGTVITGPGLQRTEPGGQYEITARFLQVGVIPAAITADTPPVP